MKTRHIKYVVILTAMLLVAAICFASCASSGNGTTTVTVKTEQSSETNETTGSLPVFETGKTTETGEASTDNASSTQTQTSVTDTPPSDPTETQTPEPDKVKKGDVITFGAYEQDNDESNGKEAIEWIVLDEADGKALLLSKYALDCKKFNETFTDVTWESCTLRSWLNDSFFKSAFSGKEQSVIVSTALVNANNPTYGTSGGNDTTDKVFLLSLDDVRNTSYGFAGDFGTSDPARECKATEYAKAHGCRVFSGGDNDGNCWWWLRSPGDESNIAARVSRDGYVGDDGSGVDDDTRGVRPAIWIAIEGSFTRVS